jgi:hypothetical protein
MLLPRVASSRRRVVAEGRVASRSRLGWWFTVGLEWEFGVWWCLAGYELPPRSNDGSYPHENESNMNNEGASRPSSWPFSLS